MKDAKVEVRKVAPHRWIACGYGLASKECASPLGAVHDLHEQAMQRRKRK